MRKPKGARAICILCGAKTFIRDGFLVPHFEAGPGNWQRCSMKGVRI